MDRPTEFDSTPPSNREVKEALERVLASKGFRGAEALGRFLRFVVEQAIEGKADRLKEFTLGAEVLERGSAFDPQTDPIVRVQAGRLRAKLSEYYEKDGKDDRVRIALPRGGYAPEFTVAAGGAPATPHRARTGWWLAIMGIPLTTAILWMQLTHPSVPGPATGEAVRATVDPPPGATPVHFALSPDGRSMAIVATEGDTTQLWLRAMSSSNSRKIAGTGGVTNSPPFWAPDSRSIGFFANGELKRLDVDSGLIRTICPAPLAVGGAWSRNGAIVFSPGVQAPLFRVGSEGGAPVAVTTLEAARSEESHRFPYFLADGRRFVFYVRAARSEHSGAYVGSLDGAAHRMITATDSAAIPVAHGRLLLNRHGTLFVAQWDPEAARLLGEPTALASGLAIQPRLRWASVSASEHGTLVFDSKPAVSPEREMFWFNRQGKPGHIAGKIVNSRHISLSPHSLNVAYDYPDPETGSAAIALLDLRRSISTLVTTPPLIGDLPVLSRDGRRIAYRMSVAGDHELVVRDLLSASGATTLLLRSKTRVYPTDWSPDGRYLLFDRLGEGERSGSWLISSTAPAVPRLFQAGATLAHFSPDGRLVAYVSNGNGRKEVFVTDARAAESRWQVSANGGSKPRWSTDGRSLFYLAPDLHLMEAAVRTDGKAIHMGQPKALFLTRMDFHDERVPYAVGPGQSGFLLAPLPGLNPVSLAVIANWPALLPKSN